jgi:hypothetical protein
MVNPQPAGIFKGIFEIQKSTTNGEKFAKSGAFETEGPPFTMPALTMPPRLRLLPGIKKARFEQPLPPNWAAQHHTRESGALDQKDRFN